MRLDPRGLALALALSVVSTAYIIVGNTRLVRILGNTELVLAED